MRKPAHGNTRAIEEFIKGDRNDTNAIFHLQANLRIRYAPKGFP